jgi:GNAT superfamily N-acetyltransferase
MGRREAREVARLRVRMLEELGEMGGEDPRTLVGATEAFLQRRIGSGGHFTSVAEEEGRLVGIASLEVFERLPYPGNLSGREGYVLNVYVEPASRRRGLAGALVRDLVGVAQGGRGQAVAARQCLRARGLRGRGLRGQNAGGDGAPAHRVSRADLAVPT